jgi:ParB family chromosome partitioning protein
MSKQRRLGRGLDALLESGRRDNTAGKNDPQAAFPATEISIEVLQPGRYQPRRRLQEQGLSELADSIREQGVLQPLVVRPAQALAGGDSKFEIVAGERRWRAARMAGLQTVPVVIRELDDQSALAVALIENLQREDLNPIDQAHSLARLAEEFDLTHEQVAKAVGRSRASVSNLLRLLDLHDDVKDLLAIGRIDMGHARALLSLDAERQVSMARKADARGMSVRQVEKAVRDMLSSRTPGTADNATVDLQTRWLQRQIAGELGQKISIRPGPDGEYSLRIGFRDLTRLHEALRRLEELVGGIRNTAGPRAREAGKRTGGDN